MTFYRRECTVSCTQSLFQGESRVRRWKPKMISRTLLSISSASLWLLVLQISGCMTATIPVAPKNRDPPCTGSWNWLGSGMVTADCTAAIQKFFAVDVSRYGYRDFEFRSAYRKRKTPLLQMETPRRYTVGKWKILQSSTRQLG